MVFRHIGRNANISRTVLSPLKATRGTATNLASSRAFTTSLPVLGGAKPARGDFKSLTADDVDAFRSMVNSPSSVLSSIPYKGGEAVAQEELSSYNQDWMSKYSGASQLVLRPKSTEEVSKIVSYCVKNRIAIVPQGGNTGLVGGSVPVHDEVVLSLASMDKIRKFDDVSGILTTDAGCVLQNLDDHINDKGYMMPLDLGAKGSCHIGGNLATNAGGLRLLRYGSLHGSVLGIEAVIPDESGTVLSAGMNGLRKDNTGLDLKQLFVGSEGYLGIITGATILTAKRPNARNIAVLALPNFETVQEVFKHTRNYLNEILSAFEFWDQEAFSVVLDHTGQKIPFENPDEYKQGDKFYVLIETNGSNKDHDDEKLGALLEYLMENDAILDGVLAQDETQLNSLWAMREAIPESAGKLGSVYKYDVSLPPSKMYELVLATRKRLQEEGLYQDGTIKAAMGYGHFGDSNIHLNVVCQKYDPKIEDVLEPWIYKFISEMNGSISAEHGLGVMKAPYIQYSQTPEAVELMKRIKPIFDKQGILNPGKYILN